MTKVGAAGNLCLVLRRKFLQRVTVVSCFITPSFGRAIHILNWGQGLGNYHKEVGGLLLLSIKFLLFCAGVVRKWLRNQKITVMRFTVCCLYTHTHFVCVTSDTSNKKNSR